MQTAFEGLIITEKRIVLFDFSIVSLGTSANLNADKPPWSRPHLHLSSQQ